VIIGLGAFSITISFATSTTIQNFDSGILVQVDKTFQIGDEIKVLNFEVKMVKTSIRTAVLENSKGHASN